MSRKDFKILLAMKTTPFVSEIRTRLSGIYTVRDARELTEFSSQVHATNFDMIIIDCFFSGMKAEEVY